MSNSTKHMPGPIDEKVTRVAKAIEALAECAEILPKAMSFTYVVERFINPPDDGRLPITEAMLSLALYDLRASIVKATGSTTP